MLAEAWAALGGDPASLVAPAVTGGPGPFGGPLAVDELAAASAGAALAAAAELAAQRGAPMRRIELDASGLAAAFMSERHLRLDGAPPPPPFAPLSRFARTADGWIRLHANYPHHRAALLTVIETVEDAARWRGEELETAIVAAGGCAAAMRTPAQWAAHPQGAAVARLALLDMERGPGGAPPLPALPGAAPPAAGVRVLDLTRVIAGPVGTRTLGVLGADVLRIDPPQLPELEQGWHDAGLGKRSALLDLRDAAGRDRLEALLAQADVLVTGYRPGALAAFGLDAEAVAARHPHLATVTLSAWGHVGPWAGRRGFDSLVQSACGIAARTAAPDGTPGVLPAQALDHATGYLVAAAALRALTTRTRDGRTLHARLALARTAHWLMAQPPVDREPAPLDAQPFLQRLGSLMAVAPPGAPAGRPLRWAGPPPPYGRDEPAFAPRRLE
ncbi:CoA transferase [Capillimicrobium parvum]|uniref:Formyl-CoA:oxalate CoA-transferase n=1 Tax=Capillimicrobium parvum TaxID=2884022 RepID=A0A9E6XU22_9ACTN|nr:CoA transferase [Capillimicrobium parvum]UGS34133.1 Formyl-CoA:oxalate CoA-transferase [Capillimicrobium parvum]